MQSHSLSFPSIPSHLNRRLVSVRSEGATTVREKLEVSRSTGQIPAAPSQNAGTNESHVIDYSSDDSGAEDELIVRIDSPSLLSFPQDS